MCTLKISPIRICQRHGIPFLDLPSPPDLKYSDRAHLKNSLTEFNQGTYLTPPKTPVIPFTDAAGEIIAVGSGVSQFEPGARCISTFHPRWLSGYVASSMSQLTNIGATSDGVIRQYIVFNEDALVPVPTHLSYEEAATLPCAGVTAWSALFGGRRGIRPGDCVLVQGSGGVSLFALMFAKAAGAFVIATTRELGGKREKKLKELGADVVLSYRDDDWGTQAKNASPARRGADFIVETSGAGQQNSKALAMGGSIAAVGGGNGGGGSSMLNVREFGPTDIRRLTVGSREQFEEMNRAMEVNALRPVVDQKFWRFRELKEMLDYARTGKVWGKVVVTVCEEEEERANL
jgi:NADPH:quinone reductase-like Zn-dependent oxidoreductase